MFRQPQATPARYQDMRPTRAPEPPLNPYMRYSRRYWHKVRLENQDRPLWDIAKIIANRWREAPEAEKNEYQLQYEHDRMDYEKQLKAYTNTMNSQQSAIQKRTVKQPDRSGRRQDPNAGVVIQAVNDEDPFEITAERLSAMRFERNQRLILELFNGNAMADARNFIAPQRIDALRRQADNLEVHKRKIAEDMSKAEESFAKRKRLIVDGAADFEEELKTVSDKRPNVTEEFYNNLVEEASKKLLEQFETYKKRQELLRLHQEAERKQTPILYSLTINTPESEESADKEPEGDEETKMEVGTPVVEEKKEEDEDSVVLDSQVAPTTAPADAATVECSQDAEPEGTPPAGEQPSQVDGAADAPIAEASATTA